jgi:hypothetical protein
MEEPLLTFELREKYLLVVGFGKRDNFSQMVKVSEMIYEKLLETNSKALLVDYRMLEVNLNMNEAFNIVKRSEKTQPQFKELIAATVVGPSAVEFGRFWKHVANQRGFKGELFEDFDQAEKWLLEQIEKTEG